ncbi:MAG: hypothetical protein HW416_2976 [Chloroflexi bacterium]|nr:hypothetical protein [Chloroflexota bacterium]
MNVRFEVSNLLSKALASPSSIATKRVFNAALAMYDGTGAAQPYLAEALPRLNTDTWRVFPDGRMETTYRLKPNLTWHDGTPLSSEDFAFAFRVYSSPNPNLRVFAPKPQDVISEISTPDARTLVISWTSLYPDAGAIVTDDLDPLPRHFMEAPFLVIDQGAEGLDAFLNSTYWTAKFVGVGPYKLEHWEPGAHIDGLAFDGHALGRPRIDRIIIRPLNDETANLTSMLAGSSQVSVEGLRFEHGAILKKEWTSGSVIDKPGSRHYLVAQFKPDYLKIPALMDVRVRKAIAHGIDRETLNEVLFDRQGFMTETFIAPQMSYYPDIDRAITKYPYDARRAEQLMTEAGFSKDRDGLFASAAGERFRPDFWEDASVIYEREGQIMADSWARVGFDTRQFIIPAAQAGDSEFRATFPALYASSVNVEERRISIFTASELATAANRWRGGNRFGWTNPDYERFWDGYNSKLDRSERNQQIVQMMKVLSDEVPAWGLYFNTVSVAVASGLTGPSQDTPESLLIWNLHLWEMK